MRRFFPLALVMLLCMSTLVAAGKKEQPEVAEREAPMTTTTREERFFFIPIQDELLAKLNVLESHIILQKGTERAFTGKYTDTTDEGTYYCRQCDTPLYYSEDKFHSNCGWPSFDDELPEAVRKFPDPDGMRTEIVCATCEGHLGHVFVGEGYTDKDIRHCVNSISLVFKPGPPVAKAVFAGGCFWGVEYLFEKLEGVHAAISGYTGGHTENPTYRQVLTHTTGHLEAVEVRYDPRIISYEQLAKYFFEIHDPTQSDGQGPDIGNQYLSAIYYRNRVEYDTAIDLIGILEGNGMDIATKILPAAVFWPAEEYHQDYYELKGTLPYCHAWTKRF
ncbi:MAG: peptide-methionine (S)-S-oxide reductase [Spirochaetae bacterium HGW-Spirochaetae-2]|nr:MAG: peptide-methionine (S)-S-oxide reductase [Spirochaetae bacterium HGW-Spirochaetae-2]